MLLKLKGKLALITILGVLVFGCEREPVVAKVNGEAITRKDLKTLLEHAGIKEGAQQTAEAHKGLRQELLNQLINEKLALQAARKAKIKVEKTEVMKAYDSIIAGAAMKEEDFLKKLKERGMSKEKFIRSVENDLTIRRYMDSFGKEITVSDDELKAYYDGNLPAFTMNEQLRLSIIRVDNPEEAGKIKRELDKGAKFEDMAQKYPAGHTGPGGTETGWVTLDTFPRDIAKEIGKIKAGSFAGPIKGKEGYYLIKVIEKREKKVNPFGEVKENIRHMLIQQKLGERFQNWLQNERKQAKIEVMGNR